MSETQQTGWPFSKEHPVLSLDSYRYSDGRLWMVGRKIHSAPRRAAAIGASAVARVVGRGMESAGLHKMGSKVEHISAGIDRAIRAKMIRQLAEAIHQTERNTHEILPDDSGLRTSEWRETRDPNWIAQHGNQVDIANHGLWDLPRDWINENIAEAGLVVDLLCHFGPRALNHDVNGVQYASPSRTPQIGTIINDQWFLRNQWRLGDEAERPNFAQLTPALQDRDLEHFRLAAQLFPDEHGFMMQAAQRDLDRRDATDYHAMVAAGEWREPANRWQ